MKKIDEWFFNDEFEFVEDTFHGVKLFVDGKHIYQDKRSMLYANAIGFTCSACGEFTKKDYIYCKVCQQKVDKERYLKCDVVEPTKHLYSDYLDLFFDNDDWSPLYDELCEKDSNEVAKLTFEDLQIYTCEDIFAQTIDIENLFDDGPEDFDISSFSEYNKLDDLINQANNLIIKNPIGYCKSNKRIEISEEAWNEMKKDVLEIINEN